MIKSLLYTNLNHYKNTIKFLIGIQIPENYINIVNLKSEFTKLKLPNNEFFFQVTKPNFKELKFKFKKLNPIIGVNSFVLGYVAKIIDIYISHSSIYYIKNKISTRIFFQSILNNFYNLSSDEILYFLILNNKNLVNNINPNLSTLNFGIGSFAALYDYSSFLNNNKNFNTYLSYYLNSSHKKYLIKRIENNLIDNIYCKKLYINDLYINSITNYKL